ncbi:hypothetical protein AYO20_04900 [Fonsecaea nubica]|uniref:Uncharacterized protein n=1 Tax=Fonsecaea nubica TaxID=856822 RepID=A0A178D0R2_9EURO|nr:hypothetical protein AYO20_04900 [Fonsecaea nubica]OAL35750.1 hypothetical protein AYO20_04900 [Fonsecaea nubica]
MPEPENVTMIPILLPSATPSSLAATPRFQRATPTVRDDIQTNVDDNDDDEADSAISSKGRLIATTGGGDILDFDDDETHQTLSPLYIRGVRVAEDVEEDDHDPGNEPSSPLQHRLRDPGPATKRRKVSHPGTNVSAAPIAISSSSPEHHDLDETSFQIDADSPTSLSDLEDDIGQPRRPTAAFNDSSSRISRFRPIPTSTRGLTLHSPVVSRTVFKPPGPDDPAARASTGSGTGTGPVLPDIFSPSRRRGKRDYLPGGSASLVRSWVLDIATRESHVEFPAEETLQVAQVERDASGRFVLVSDDQGHRWLLPEQQHERPGSGGGGGSRRSSLDHSWSDVRPGSRILIKGKATRWTIDLGSQGLGDVVVAAYWEPTTSPG